MARVRFCADCKEWVVGSHDCPMRCRACHHFLSELELAVVELVVKKLGPTAPRLCGECRMLLKGVSDG